MLSDMVGRGSFHRHIMTSGGRAARPSRIAQPDIDCTLPAIPAVQTAETQTAANVALMESSCILKVYGSALYRAVPECTSKEELVPCCCAVRLGTAESGYVRYSLWNGRVPPTLSGSSLKKYIQE